MEDDQFDLALKQHALYIDERKMLIDAGREAARTFDQAVLAFGSAVFGFSVAFLKDVAPKPASYSLKWLGCSWFLFSCGLLTILLSFLFSARACEFEIEVGANALGSSDFRRPKNSWSAKTIWCNYLSIGLLFLGLRCWSAFAFENLSRGDQSVSADQPSKIERGYVPPPAPARVPPPATPAKNFPPTAAEMRPRMRPENETPGRIPFKDGYVPPRTPPPPPTKVPPQPAQSEKS